MENYSAIVHTNTCPWTFTLESTGWLRSLDCVLRSRTLPLRTLSISFINSFQSVLFVGRRFRFSIRLNFRALAAEQEQDRLTTVLRTVQGLWLGSMKSVFSTLWHLCWKTYLILPNVGSTYINVVSNYVRVCYSYTILTNLTYKGRSKLQ